MYPAGQYSGNKKISDFSTVHFDNLLGTGVFGRVFDCTFKQGNTQIFACAKVLSKKDIPQKMLERQIQVLKILQGEENPNIVKIYEIVISEQDNFIVMEKCSGGDLNDLRKRRKDNNQPFTELEVKSLIRAIANAYKACMKHRIIHRDIKPAKILLHDNKFLLTGFGMGRIIEDIGNRRRMSNVGSPLYATPQILHDSPYSIKCDVYSLGVVAFLLLYNTFPVKAGDINELKQNQNQYKDKDFKCPENPNISPEMKGLIESMLQYDEDKRIGWIELVEHKLIKSKIQILGSDEQMQVQLQQTQPHNELLVTGIGSEPAEITN